eukprot:TRINITY_DN9029_c0_g2_i1.p1 TRINITY_DN9029_c0_g2~~TRINITY_DN9029_c0_g2_i1.p1  ORF type:complete len:577 (-),score=90.57 TRINITY_DN9029_c0_g2_i1:93-1823(-)
MQVRIDAVPGQATPDDTFVAMRVGDVQKQSRYAASRTYRFPEPRDGRGRFGRIEVYQRVGHVTMRFDYSGDFKLVEVPCKFVGETGAGISASGRPVPRRLDLHVAASRSCDATADARSAARERVDLAQKYLEQHHLEEAIADAMREVVHLKPKDPHSFLSSYILKRASDSSPVVDTTLYEGVNLPPIPIKPKKTVEKEPLASASASPSPGADRAAFFASKSTSDSRLDKFFEPTLARPPSRGELRRLPPLEVTAKPPQQASARRPAPQTSARNTAAAAVVVAAQISATPPRKDLQRQTGSFALDNFPEYYRSRFKSCGNEYFSRLHAKFMERQPSLSLHPTVEAAGLVMPLPLRHKPSVGTWFAPLSLKQHAVGEVSAPSLPVKKAVASEPPPLDPATDEDSDDEQPWYYQPYQGEDAEIVEQIQEVIAQKDSELDNLRAQIRLLALAKGVPLSPSPPHSPTFNSCSVELLAPQPRRFLHSACHAQMPPTEMQSSPNVVNQASSETAMRETVHNPTTRSLREFCTANVKGMIQKTLDWRAKFKQGLLPNRSFIAALRAELSQKDAEINALRSQLKA